MSRRVKLGTRGSALARWQAAYVADALRALEPAIEIEISVISTEADEQPDTPVASLRERGAFVRQLGQAVLAGTVDAAVHSLKDMPSTETAGLAIAAISRRDEARDALLSRDGWDLERLPKGARVGTGSPRRRSMLLHARPDLDVVGVRGNVDTRVQALKEGRFDALVLALAGFERLGITGVEATPLAPSRCLPAVGQGALAVEVRANDAATLRLMERLDHPASRACCSAERAFLRELGAGCLAPATAYARVVEDRLEVEAMAGTPEGEIVLWESETGAISQAEVIGVRLARRLSLAGAERILARARGA